MYTFELTHEQVDRIITNELKDQLKYLEREMAEYERDPHENWIHPDDVPYNKKMIKALKKVIGHYGG